MNLKTPSKRMFPVVDSYLWFKSGNKIYYIPGNVGIGTSSPSALLHLAKESANTSTIQEILRIVATSTGIVSNNFGTSINFYLDDTSGNSPQLATSIAGIWITVNQKSKSSAITFSGITDNGKLTEWVRLYGEHISSNASLDLNTIQTTIKGTTGTAIWFMPFQGTSYKKFLVYLTNFTSSGLVIDFPVAFSKTPYVYGNTTVTAIATTTKEKITLTSTETTTGFIIIEGY